MAAGRQLKTAGQAPPQNTGLSSSLLLSDRQLTRWDTISFCWWDPKASGLHYDWIRGKHAKKKEKSAQID